jgi:hypothetical protein
MAKSPADNLVSLVFLREPRFSPYISLHIRAGPPDGFSLGPKSGDLKSWRPLARHVETALQSQARTPQRTFVE